MADTFDWDVIVRFATQGAQAVGADLEKLERSVDKITQAQIKNERASGSAAKAASELTKQERLLNRERKARDTAAWDREFEALTKATGAAQGATSAFSSLDDQAVRLRYANYDLARSMFTVSAAITAVGASTLVAFGSQEAAFTEVERIVGGSVDQIQGLRDELQALSTEIPRSFQDLSGIAALGAALDIPAGSLAAFSDVVARFATVTGVTEEAAATGFGRLAQYLGLTQDEYENLGSAILKAGNISVATEEQVLKFSQALALPAARAELASDQVVALGAAIASFGNINVEGAGSALNRIFTNIQRGVAEGGQTLENFAAVSGIAANRFGLAWQDDAGDVLNRVLAGLSTDVDNLALNLDALGIRNIRDRRVIEALAINYGAYRDILQQTSTATEEGTYLGQSYSLVLDDLNSKWTIFLNAVTNAAAAAGSALAPAIGQLLDLTTDLLVNLADFATSDFGQHIIRVVTVLGTAVAVFAALRGGIALATASLFAFRTATASLGGIGIIAGLRALASTFGLVRSGAAGAAGATFTLRNALIGLGKATVILGAIQLIATALGDLGGTFMWLADVATNVVNFIGTVFSQVVSFVSDSLGALANITLTPFLRDALRDASRETRIFSRELEKIGLGDVSMGGFRDWAESLPKAADDLENLGNVADIPWEEYSDDAENYGNALGGVGDGAEEAANEIRTLVDYASDLQGVFSRAFDIRFGASSTLDKITTSFRDIREATEESARNIRSLKAEIQGLQSDLSIQRYFLGIAVEYGDVKRVEAIQANISKLQADLAEKTADLSGEQSKNSKELTGNSKAAIANRATLEGLVQQYQAHVVALASSGLGQQELARRTEQLRQDFIRQATQLGFSRSEIERYSRALGDLTRIVGEVPRNVTIAANSDPAVQALNEYRAAADRANASLNGLRANSTQPISIPRTGTVDSTGDRQLALRAEIAATEAALRSGKYKGFEQSIAAALAEMRRLLATGGYASGGFTGRGGRLEPAGIVHRGEYVIPKHQVNQRTGLPYADAMGKLQRGASGPGYANGGYVRGGGSVYDGHISSFGPMAQQQLQQALQQIVLLDGQRVATSSAAQYAQSTAHGAY